MKKKSYPRKFVKNDISEICNTMREKFLKLFPWKLESYAWKKKKMKTQQKKRQLAMAFDQHALTRAIPYILGVDDNLYK